jgi:hypothetical protein
VGLKRGKKSGKKIIINSLIHQRNIKQLRLSAEHVSRIGFALLVSPFFVKMLPWQQHV